VVGFPVIVEKHFTRRLDFGLRPSNAEFDAMLAELGQEFGHDLATLLGVPVLTLRGWRKGKNGPCAASRKTVWLTWCLLLHPEKVKTIFDLATWGRFQPTLPSSWGIRPGQTDHNDGKP